MLGLLPIRGQALGAAIGKVRARSPNECILVIGETASKERVLVAIAAGAKGYIAGDCIKNGIGSGYSLDQSGTSVGIPPNNC
jgi:hypothetical protein